MNYLQRLKRIAKQKGGDVIYSKKQGYTLLLGDTQTKLGRDCVHALFALEKVLKEVS
jgi:hypothetical protein